MSPIVSPPEPAPAPAAGGSKFTLAGVWRLFLAEEPVIIAWALNGGLSLLAAYVFHWDHTYEAAAATILTAAASVFTALRARPVSVSAVTGAVVTGLTAAATFGLAVSPQVMAVGVSALSAVLALVFRQNLTPKKAAGA